VPGDVAEAALAGAWAVVLAAREGARRPDVAAARAALAAGGESRTAYLAALAAILDGRVAGPAAVVACAVLAVTPAERRAAAEAAAVGAEVAARLTAALAPVGEAWLPEGAAARIGAAAGAARAVGAGAATTATAIGVAATQCAGFRDSPELRCRALGGAKAAADAVEAMRLAEAGFTAPAAALEGRRGVFALLLGEPGAPGGLLARLGDAWTPAPEAEPWPDGVAVGRALG
jgi:hypothetical protein